MTFYPCASCQHLVDAAGGLRCTHCGTDHPFRCCRCDAALTRSEVFQPDHLYPGKLLYCNPCGEAMELVECATCGLRLLRSEGLSSPGGGVHHPECWRRALRAYRLVHPFLVLGMAAGLAYAGYSWDPSGWTAAGVAGVLGAAGGEVAARRLRPR